MAGHVLEYLSHSRLAAWRQCSLRFAYTYIPSYRMKPAFVAGALAFGIAFHEAVQEALIGLMAGGFPPVADLVTAFERSLDAQASEIPIQFGEKEDRRTMVEQARRMLKVWTAWPRPPAGILAIEHEFRIPIAEWLPPLVGRVDLIEQLEDGSVALVDVKTSRGRWSEDDLMQHAGQLALYLAGVQDIVAAIGKPVRVGFEVITKAKNPTVERLYLEPEMMESFERQVKVATLVAEAVERGIFVPSPSWACATCPFQELCRSW